MRTHSQREGDEERHPLLAALLQTGQGRAGQGSSCSPEQFLACPGDGSRGGLSKREGQREKQVGVQRGDEVFGMENIAAGRNPQVQK